VAEASAPRRPTAFQTPACGFACLPG
jgi:hypothetical protein